MKLTPQFGSPNRQHRAAFSLIELLVVIAIIGVLTALSVYVTLSVMEGRRQDNTSANFNTLQKLLMKHWAKVIEDAQKETPSAAVMALSADSSGNQNADRAKIIWTKLRLIEAFPLSYAEVQGAYAAVVPPAGIPYLAPYIPQSRKYNVTYKGNLSGQSNTPPHITESSACLVLALSVNRGGIGAISDQDASLVDTDADGFKEIVDGWGNAIRFFRFPSGNPGLNAAAPSSGTTTYLDPDDPRGLLIAWSWWNSPNRITFETLCGYTIANVAPTATSKGTANYVIPVLVSGGRDNQTPPPGSGFGLNLPPDNTMTPDGTGKDLDNIFSYTLRLGS